MKDNFTENSRFSNFIIYLSFQIFKKNLENWEVARGVIFIGYWGGALGSRTNTLFYELANF